MHKATRTTSGTRPTDGRPRVTRSMARALGITLGLALTASACSSEATAPATTTAETTTSTTTTSTTEATTTTLSDAQLNNLAIDEAEAEVTRIVTEWWTFPYDTDLGEAGIPLEYITGVVRDRELAALLDDQEAGRRFYSHSESQISILSTGVDLVDKTGVVEFCGLGNTALTQPNGETTLPSGQAWRGTAYLSLTELGWKVSEFISDELRDREGLEGERCEV